MTAFSGHIKETSSDCSASDTYQASPSDLINNFIQGKIVQLLRQKTHRVALVSAFSLRLASLSVLPPAGLFREHRHRPILTLW